MKQNLKFIFFSCLVGAILAGVFFGSIKEKAEAKSTSMLSVFQVGVFKNKENAFLYQQNYEVAKVVKDQDVYRVFVGVTSSNQELLKSLFDSFGYTYYIKEMYISDSLCEAIQKYDIVLAQASSTSQMEILKTMLGMIPDEL